MSAAIYALVGVAVGGFITWGIEYWRAKRGEADEKRVAARLVVDELASISVVREGMEGVEPQFREWRERALRQEAWFAHRAVLARELDDEGWLAVRAAYEALSIEYDPDNPSTDANFVRREYERAQTALKPLTTSERRYWWQRLRYRISRQPASPTS
jgi:hypothetical protein